MRNRKGFALMLLLSVILLLGWKGPVYAQNAGLQPEKGIAQLGINGDYFMAGNTDQHECKDTPCSPRIQRQHY